MFVDENEHLPFYVLSLPHSLSLSVFYFCHLSKRVGPGWTEPDTDSALYTHTHTHTHTETYIHTHTHTHTYTKHTHTHINIHTHTHTHTHTHSLNHTDL